MMSVIRRLVVDTLMAPRTGLDDRASRTDKATVEPPLTIPMRRGSRDVTVGGVSFRLLAGRKMDAEPGLSFSPIAVGHVHILWVVE
jgi:hypothetical protein